VKLPYLHWFAIGTVAFALNAASCHAAEAESAKPAEPQQTHRKEQKPPVLPSPEEIDQAIHRGLDFLIQKQNKDGSWGSPRKTKDLNIFAPIGAHQAFRAGVTAMCIEALIETGAPDTDPKAKAALDRGEEWLLANLPHVRRADGVAIYNVWTHSYGIQALVAMHKRTQDEGRRKQIDDLIVKQFEMLRRYESVDGGWGYYDFDVGAKRPAASSTSFVTATALVAFDRARSIGIAVPEDLKKRAIASINRQKKGDHSYAYGEYLKMRPMMGINRPGGSLGRSQACNLALRLWGDKGITDKVVTTWLERLYERNGWLSIGRKRPVPHESWFQVAGYFYYYGHYYASLCTDLLNPKAGNHYKQILAGIIIPLQEKDGSWWDFPLYDYHQPYGTSFALMTLVHCKPKAG
jgi:hypothetical protein